MSRALIAALLLTACSGTEPALLGSEFRDAGVREAGPLEIACDIRVRELLEELREKGESNDFPSICRIQPYARECPLFEVYGAVTGCLSALGSLLPNPSEYARDE